MVRIALTSLLSTFLMLFVSCTQETFVVVRDSSVAAKLDLFDGFEGRHVNLYLNGQLSYSATLGTLVPLSGPIDQFETSLFHGVNTIVAECWQEESPGSSYTKRTTTVILGDADKYFLALSLRSDTLLVNVQDTPFIYI